MVSVVFCVCRYSNKLHLLSCLQMSRQTEQQPVGYDWCEWTSDSAQASESERTLAGSFAT